MLNKKLQIVLSIVSVGVICFGIFVLIFVFGGSNRLQDTNTTKRLEFSGGYKVDDSTEFLPLSDDVRIDSTRLNTVVFQGHFTRKVEQSEQIMFRSVNLIFSVSVNGEKVYSFGQAGGNMPLSPFSKSPGNCWAVWDCGGISPSDEITITVNNVYTSIYKEQYQTFYTNIYAGSTGGLYQIMYDKNFFSYVFGAGLFFLGAVLVIISIALFCFEHKITMRYLWLSLGAFVSGIWCYIDFDYISLFFPYPVFINMLDIVSLCFMLIFMLLYMKSFLKNKVTNIVMAASAFFINAFLASGIILQLCGVCDLQELMNILTILLTGSGAIMLTCVVYETVKYKTKDTLMIALNLLPLFVCGVLQAGFYAFANYQKSTFLRLGILLFCVFAFVIMLFKVRQTIIKLRKSFKTELALSQKENELLESQIMLMLSQIQPHFLFNTLTAVGQLCSVNPPLAEKAVHNFADYLRGNIDAIGQNSMIPFSREIEHARVYLELEKMRFDERVRAEFDLKATDFMIPTLTVQTLVENAVKHGITKKKSGGTVKIESREQADCFIVIVSDDGVGFDIEQKQSDENTHIGIKNVTMRLKSICGGTLKVKSQVGIGTEVTIQIPKFNQAVTGKD